MWLMIQGDREYEEEGEGGGGALRRQGTDQEETVLNQGWLWF